MNNSKLKKRQQQQHQHQAEKFREKIDFKFVFHVTRVPHSGWEKLYVSLESTETGKTTAKTAKSLVQNGTCRWPDAIVESTRMVHDTRSNSYDSKLYKFVVGMSPTRVLGEITLNLADYVSATSPAAAPSAFPLKNCSAGTVLHMKIQCLSSGDCPRESEVKAEANANDHLSEDDLDDTASVTSSMNFPPPTPNREKLLTRYNSDLSDVSTPLANGSSKSCYSPEMPSPTGSGSNSFNSRLERNGRRASLDSSKMTPSTPTRSARMSLSALTTRSSVEGRGDAYENGCKGAEVSKLEHELESLRQQLSELGSRKDEEISVLSGERGNLQKELLSQKQRLDDLCGSKDEEISALSSSCRNLQGELERLREAKRACEEEHAAAQSSMKLQLEDCSHMIKELQQVLAYEKNSRENLDAQLKSVQDSNMQLESTVRELERHLREEKKRMENVYVKNMELQTSLMEQEQTMAEVESVLSHKLELKEEENKALEEKCAELEAIQAASKSIDPNEIVELRKEVEELEVDIKELTDENMDLIFKLNAANKELSRFSGESDYLGLMDIEGKLNKFRDEHDSTKGKLLQLETANKELKAARTDLEVRLKSLMDETQVLKSDLKASRSMHAVDREAFSGREQRLKERADDMHEKYSMTFGLVAELQTELENLKKENSENRRRKDELEAAMNSLEMSKTDMAYRLADLESENLKSRSLSRKYESDLGERTQELRFKAAKISDMESKILMLEASNNELESRIQELQSRDMLSTSRIVDLEVQLSSTKRELDSVDTKKVELEAKVDNLELEKYELGSMLRAGQEDNRFLKEKLESIMGELAESNAQLEMELAARTNSEKRVAEFGSSKVSLEKKVSQLEDENWQLTERVAGLEAQLNYLTEERDSYKLRTCAAENRAVELQEQSGRLEGSLEQTSKEYDSRIAEYEVQLNQVLEERDAHAHARKRLESQIQELKLQCSELEENRDECINELKKSYNSLEENLQKMRSSYEESVELRKSLEVKVAESEQELARQNEELEVLGNSKLEVEERVKRAEELLQRAQAERSIAVERLQAELQRLTDQMDATCDEKEGLASRALIEASELRAEKLEWEDMRKELEEKAEHADAETEALRKENQTMKKREAELMLKMKHEADKLADVEASGRSVAAELARKIELLNQQVEKLVQDNAELRNKVDETSHDSDRYRNALDRLQDEKNDLETSMKSLEAENVHLEDEKTSLQDQISALNQALLELDQLKASRAELEEKIQRLESEQAASRSHEVEQRCESIKLRRQHSEMKQKMTESEAEREELRRKVEGLEADLRKRRAAGGGDENGKTPNGNGVLAAKSPSKCNAKVGTREGQELSVLRDRVRALEVELKLRTAEAEALRKKESGFQKRIEALEASSGSHGEQQQQQDEQGQRPKEDSSARLDSQEMLQKEVQRLQQANMQLQEKLARFKETSKCGNTLERVASLEMELAEALESNTMYKEQLRSAFATQQNVHAAALQNLGDVDQVVSDLLSYKRKSGELETELCEMRERYLSMSLKFAEVEAEREELVMMVRSLKNGRKSFF